MTKLPNFMRVDSIVARYWAPLVDSDVVRMVKDPSQGWWECGLWVHSHKYVWWKTGADVTEKPRRTTTVRLGQSEPVVVDGLVQYEEDLHALTNDDVATNIVDVLKRHPQSQIFLNGQLNTFWVDTDETLHVRYD